MNTHSIVQQALPILPWLLGIGAAVLFFKYIAWKAESQPVARHGAEREVEYKPRDWEAVHNSQNNPLLAGASAAAVASFAVLAAQGGVQRPEETPTHQHRTIELEEAAPVASGTFDYNDTAGNGSGGD